MTQLFDDIYKRIFLFVYKKVNKNVELAQDVTQLTLCKCLEEIKKKGKKYDSEQHFINALKISAYHRFIDWLRRFKRYNEKIISNESEYVNQYREYLSKQTVSPLQITLNEEMKQALSEAIRTLRPNAQLILELKYFEGLRSKEIAEKIHRTDDYVRQVLTRSMATLRKNDQLRKYFQ